MKWLINYLGNAINMENIVSVVWIPVKSRNDEVFKNEVLNSNTKEIVFATDVNNNRIILGEYTSLVGQDVVDTIVNWLNDSDDSKYFHIPSDEDMNELDEE